MQEPLAWLTSQATASGCSHESTLGEEDGAMAVEDQGIYAIDLAFHMLGIVLVSHGL